MNSNAIEKTAVSHLNLAITQCEFLRTCVRSNYCTQLLSSRSSQRFVEQNSRTLSQNEERKAGLSENPTQALIDSQSVKTTGAVDQKGFDMGKKRKE